MCGLIKLYRKKNNSLKTKIKYVKFKYVNTEGNFLEKNER